VETEHNKDHFNARKAVSPLKTMEALDPMVDESAKVEEEARLAWDLACSKIWWLLRSLR
jgi:hypothetical protein